MSEPHWSKTVCVLCWCDPKSNGRRRMSWGTREQLERMAYTMTDEHDAVMYNGLANKLVIRPVMPPSDQPTTAERKPKKPKKAKAKAPKPAV